MPAASDYSSPHANVPATILNGQTVSAEIDLFGTTLCGIILPVSFTGTSISFQSASLPGGTFCQLTDGTGAVISKTVGPSKFVSVNPMDFMGVRHLKLVSNAAEGADRAITLRARPI